MWTYKVCSGSVNLIGNGYAKKRGGWYAAKGPSTNIFEWFLSLTCYSYFLSTVCWPASPLEVSGVRTPAQKQGSVRTSGIALLFFKIKLAPYSFLYLSCPLLLFSPGLSMDFMRKSSKRVLLFLLIWWTEMFSSFVVIVNSSPLKLW